MIRLSTIVLLVLVPLLACTPSLPADDGGGEGEVGHSGGVVFSAAEAEEVSRFRAFITRLGNDDTCGAGSIDGIADEDLCR